jgi:hypothetical protein
MGERKFSQGECDGRNLVAKLFLIVVRLVWDWGVFDKGRGTSPDSARCGDRSRVRPGPQIPRQDSLGVWPETS